MSRQGLGNRFRLHRARHIAASVAACGLVQLIVAVPVASAHADPPAVAAAHVRPLDRCGARLLDEALAQSAIVRGLVSQLADTDVVVYLTSAQPHTRLTGMPRGKTRFMSATPASRFLQIWVDPVQRPAVRVAVLAHELQHALEVAAAGVRDVSGFRRLYEGLGLAGHGAGAPAGVSRFETAAAVAVEARVMDELRRRTAMAAAPGGD